MQIAYSWNNFDLKKKINQKHFLFKKLIFIKSKLKDENSFKKFKIREKKFLFPVLNRSQTINSKDLLLLNFSIKNKKEKKQIILLNYNNHLRNNNSIQFFFQKNKKKYWNLIYSF